MNDVVCLLDISKGGNLTHWVKGEIVQTYDRYVVVQFKCFKECFLKVDECKKAERRKGRLNGKRWYRDE